MAQEDTGTARAAARSSAAKPGSQANDHATDQAAAELALAVAKALGEQLSGAIREVFSEQRDLFAGQAALREADYVLVREMVEEQRERRAKDAELLKKIDKQAATKRPEPVSTRRIDADPGQLLLGLQFNALSNALGSRKRTRAGRDDSLIPPPEITRSAAGKPGFRMTFVAPLPSGAQTVGIQYLDNRPKDLVRIEDLTGNSTDIASDQVQFVEVLDGRALPVAFGIPYRR